MEIAQAVTAIGLIVFLAYLFSALFQKTRIPDVLPLVLIGALLGPVLGVATKEHFGVVGPIFSIVTLVIILFESGLNMKVSYLKEAALPASILGGLGFAMSLGIVMIVAMHFLELDWIHSLILGSILGGTAASITVPLLKALNLSNEKTITLMLESVIGNVLTIVVTMALMGALREDALRTHLVLSDIFVTFTFGCLLGAVFGLIWSLVIRRVRRVASAKFTTPACVCICYGLTEMCGFSGMMSALAFGIVLGNAKKIPFSSLAFSWGNPSSANSEEQAIFSEIVFLMKTFFFVYLGITLQWLGIKVMMIGFFISLALFAVRPLAVRLALSNASTTVDEATIASVLIPRGLASSVLAAMALTYGMQEGVMLQNVAYSVIMISIALTSVLAFLCEQGLLKRPYGLLFCGYQKDENGAARKRHDSIASEGA
ncbi:MAG: cation:proton antiporter [Candidatus Obscuribacterales bacterium]